MTTRTKNAVVTKAVEHLFNLLPLYSVSRSDENNQAIAYAIEVLESLGREAILDKHFNIISKGTSNRAVVAHTDTVGSIDAKARRQSIRYNSRTDIIYNRSEFRAMGGDDKVGMAWALAVAQYIPETHVWLVANEEIGLIGSRAIEPGVTVDLAIQLDRRGKLDLVTSICGKICGDRTAKVALELLPHRKEVNGGATDVAALVDRGIAKAAFNMSCGYHCPHGADEYIILAQAMQAFLDGLVLLSCLDDEDIEAPKKYTASVDIPSSTGTYYGNYRGGHHGYLSDDEYNWDDEAIASWGKEQIWDNELHCYTTRADRVERLKKRAEDRSSVTPNKPLSLPTPKTDKGDYVASYVCANGSQLARVFEFADGTTEFVYSNVASDEVLSDISLGICEAVSPELAVILDKLSPEVWIDSLSKLELYQCSPDVKCVWCGHTCQTGVCARTLDGENTMCEDCAYSEGAVIVTAAS